MVIVESFPARTISGLFSPVISLILFTLLVLSAADSSGQKAWSLEDCIGHAMENNIQIRQQSLGVQATRIDLLEAKTRMLPNLNGYASYGYNFGQTIDPFTNQFATSQVGFGNLNISSSVTLFNGFQMLNNLKKNRIDLQADSMRLEKMKNDISLNIALAYLNILFNQEFYSNSLKQNEITELQVDRTRKMVEAGTLSKGSLLEIEAQLATEEKNLIDAENLRDMSVLTLVQLLDIPTAEGFQIQKPEISLPDDASLLATPQSIYDFAVMNQPEILGANLDVESAARSLSIARGATSPLLALQGSLGTGYSEARQDIANYKLTGIDTIGYTIESQPIPVGIPVFDYDYATVSFKNQVDENFNKSLGLYLSIPIFNGLQARSNINRSKIAILNAEYNLQLAKNTLYKTIQQAYADALAALKRYKASVKSVAALEESFKYTSEKYNVGMLNSVEYNDAKNKLMRAESEQLQAKYEFIFRQVILDFYQGNEIHLK